MNGFPTPFDVKYYNETLNEWIDVNESRKEKEGKRSHIYLKYGRMF